MTIIFRPLADLCDRLVGSVDPRRNPENEFWYIDISAVDNTAKKIVAPQRVAGKNASVRARQVVRKCDVLVSTTRPNLNAVALVSDDYDGEICSTGFCVLRCGAELDSEYLFSFIQSSIFVESVSDLVKGALYPAVTDKQIFAQQIPWVPITEQRRIAADLKAQLTAVEEARQAARAQLDDVQRLVPAILETAFAETDDAELVRIDDVARTTSGTTPSRSRKDLWEPAKYPWVKTGEVAFAPIRKTEERISEDALAECSLSLLPPGTVLIAMYGQGKTRGQSAVLEVEAATNQACFAILPNETFDPEYLQFWLRHSYQALRAQSEARGGNQSNLNGGMLSGFEVPRMPRDRQEGIAKKIKAGLAEADRVRQAIESQLREIELLPSRLLASVFEAS